MSLFSCSASIKCAADPDPRISRAWHILDAVLDPEIPVVSIRELGILREVRATVDGWLEIIITPTYSGCPALPQITEDITQALNCANLIQHRVKTVLTPAWTTDWIAPEAREKLRAYGIAPPPSQNHSAQPETKPIYFTRQLFTHTPACPRCNSTHTERISQFASTACKALYRCRDCHEPFDYFKPH